MSEPESASEAPTSAAPRRASPSPARHDAHQQRAAARDVSAAFVPARPGLRGGGGGAEGEAAPPQPSPRHGAVVAAPVAASAQSDAVSTGADDTTAGADAGSAASAPSQTAAASEAPPPAAAAAAPAVQGNAMARLTMAELAAVAAPCAAGVPTGDASRKGKARHPDTLQRISREFVTLQKVRPGGSLIASAIDCNVEHLWTRAACTQALDSSNKTLEKGEHTGLLQFLRSAPQTAAALVQRQESVARAHALVAAALTAPSQDGAAAQLAAQCVVRAPCILPLGAPRTREARSATVRVPTPFCTQEEYRQLFRLRRNAYEDAATMQLLVKGTAGGSGALVAAHTGDLPMSLWLRAHVAMAGAALPAPAAGACAQLVAETQAAEARADLELQQCYAAMRDAGARCGAPFAPPCSSAALRGRCLQGTSHERINALSGAPLCDSRPEPGPMSRQVTHLRARWEYTQTKPLRAAMDALSKVLVPRLSAAEGPAPPVAGGQPHFVLREPPAAPAATPPRSLRAGAAPSAGLADSSEDAPPGRRSPDRRDPKAAAAAASGSAAGGGAPRRADGGITGEMRGHMGDAAVQQCCAVLQRVEDTRTAVLDALQV